MPDEKTHEGESELENELEIEENDTRIEVADMIDEGDIIAAVQEAPEEEDGEEEREEESITISNIAALDSIQNIFNYLQQNSDVKVNVSVISGMKDLQRQTGRKQNASLK